MQFGQSRDQLQTTDEPQMKAADDKIRFTCQSNRRRHQQIECQSIPTVAHQITVATGIVNSIRQAQCSHQAQQPKNRQARNVVGFRCRRHEIPFTHTVTRRTPHWKRFSKTRANQSTTIAYHGIGTQVIVFVTTDVGWDTFETEREGGVLFVGVGRSELHPCSDLSVSTVPLKSIKRFIMPSSAPPATIMIPTNTPTWRCL